MGVLCVACTKLTVQHDEPIIQSVIICGTISNYILEWLSTEVPHQCNDRLLWICTCTTEFDEQIKSKSTKEIQKT